MDTPPPDPALDTLFVLIAELHKRGVIGEAELASMARRLDMAELPDEADRVRSVPLSNLFDDPDEIRAGLHIVPDGGNSDK